MSTRKKCKLKKIIKEYRIELIASMIFIPTFTLLSKLLMKIAILNGNNITTDKYIQGYCIAAIGWLIGFIISVIIH